MKKYQVLEKGKGTLLLTFITYDKKIEKMMLKSFKKLKQVDIVEAKNEA